MCVCSAIVTPRTLESVARPRRAPIVGQWLVAAGQCSGLARQQAAGHCIGHTHKTGTLGGTLAAASCTPADLLGGVRHGSKGERGADPSRRALQAHCPLRPPRHGLECGGQVRGAPVRLRQGVSPHFADFCALHLQCPQTPPSQLEVGGQAVRGAAARLRQGR